MDYSIVLNQISANQLEIIDILNNLKDMVNIIGALMAICFIYIFVRNLIKSR